MDPLPSSRVTSSLVSGELPSPHVPDRPPLEPGDSSSGNTHSPPVRVHAAELDDDVSQQDLLRSLHWWSDNSRLLPSPSSERLLALLRKFGRRQRSSLGAVSPIEDFHALEGLWEVFIERCDSLSSQTTILKQLADLLSRCKVGTPAPERTPQFAARDGLGSCGETGGSRRCPGEEGRDAVTEADGDGTTQVWRVLVDALLEVLLQLRARGLGGGAGSRQQVERCLSSLFSLKKTSRSSSKHSESGPACSPSVCTLREQPSRQAGQATCLPNGSGDARRVSNRRHSPVSLSENGTTAPVTSADSRSSSKFLVSKTASERSVREELDLRGRVKRHLKKWAADRRILLSQVQQGTPRQFPKKQRKSGSGDTTSSFSSVSADIRQSDLLDQTYLATLRLAVSLESRVLFAEFSGLSAADETKAAEHLSVFSDQSVCFLLALWGLAQSTDQIAKTHRPADSSSEKPPRSSADHPGVALYIHCLSVMCYTWLPRLLADDCLRALLRNLLFEGQVMCLSSTNLLRDATSEKSAKDEDLPHSRNTRLPQSFDSAKCSREPRDVSVGHICFPSQPIATEATPSQRTSLDSTLVSRLSSSASPGSDEAEETPSESCPCVQLSPLLVSLRRLSSPDLFVEIIETHEQQEVVTEVSTLLSCLVALATHTRRERENHTQDGRASSLPSAVSSPTSTVGRVIQVLLPPGHRTRGTDQRGRLVDSVPSSGEGGVRHEGLRPRNGLEKGLSEEDCAWAIFCRLSIRGKLGVLRAFLLLVRREREILVEGREGAASSRYETSSVPSEEPETGGTLMGEGVTVSSSAVHTAALSVIFTQLLSCSVLTQDVLCKREALLLLQQVVDTGTPAWLVSPLEKTRPSRLEQRRLGNTAADKGGETNDRKELLNDAALEKSRSPASSAGKEERSSASSQADASEASSPLDLLIALSLRHWLHPQRCVSQAARSLWEAVVAVACHPDRPASTRGLGREENSRRRRVDIPPQASTEETARTPFLVRESYDEAEKRKKNNNPAELPFRLAMAVFNLPPLHKKAQNLALLSLLPVVGVRWLLRNRPRLLQELLSDIGNSTQTRGSALKLLEKIFQLLVALSPSETGLAVPRAAHGGGSVGNARSSSAATDHTVPSGRKNLDPGLHTVERRRQSADSQGRIPIAFRRTVFPLLVSAFLSGSSQSLTYLQSPKGSASSSASPRARHPLSPRMAALAAGRLSAVPQNDRCPEFPERVAAAVLPMLQAVDPGGLSSLLQLLHCASRSMHAAGSHSHFVAAVDDIRERRHRASTLSWEAQRAGLASHGEPHGRGKELPSNPNCTDAETVDSNTPARWLPWTVGEAVLLGVGLKAGLVSWETCSVNGKGCQPRAFDSPDVEGGEDDIPTGGLARQRCVPKPTESRPPAGLVTSREFVCLSLSGTDIRGSPLCIRVPRQRVQHGLQSGDDRIRDALLTLLVSSRLSAAPPTSVELQMLLEVIQHGSNRHPTAAARAAFVDAFKRLLQRARDAYRKALAGKTPEDLQRILVASGKALSLPRTVCCPSEDTQTVSRKASGQQRPPNLPSEPAGRLLQTQAGLDLIGTTEKRVLDTMPSSTRPERQQEKEESLRSLLVFLQQLHETALLQCLPCTPPDRQQTGATVLLLLYDLWGPQAPSDLRKGSSCANAAAAAGALYGGEVVGSKSACRQEGHSTGKKSRQNPTNTLPSNTGCSVGEALGFYSAPVRAQLVGMLASPWSRERDAAYRIMKLFPKHVLCYGGFDRGSLANAVTLEGTTASIVEADKPAVYECSRPSAYRGEEVVSSLVTVREERPREGCTGLHRSRPRGNDPQHFCVGLEDAVMLLHSIRECDFSAGSSYLALLFEDVFIDPLKQVVPAGRDGRTPSASPLEERTAQQPTLPENHKMLTALQDSDKNVRPRRIDERAPVVVRALDQALKGWGYQSAEALLSPSLPPQPGGACITRDDTKDVPPSMECMHASRHLFSLVLVLLDAAQQRLGALQGPARLSAKTPGACVHGLLFTLGRLFEELPPLKTLLSHVPCDTHVSCGSESDHSEKTFSSTTGVSTQEETPCCRSEASRLTGEARALDPVETRQGEPDKGPPSRSKQEACEYVWAAWRQVVSRLLRMLLGICSSMFCVIAEGADGVMLNAVWQQQASSPLPPLPSGEGQGEKHEGQPGASQQDARLTFRVDCRGHPLLPSRYSEGATAGEKGGEVHHGRPGDSCESEESLLAVRGWVTIKAAATCVSALLAWIPFGQQEVDPIRQRDRDSDTQDVGEPSSGAQKIGKSRAAAGGVRVETTTGEILGTVSSSSPDTPYQTQRGRFSKRHLKDDGKRVVVTAGQLNAVGRRLLHFLLSCRHPGKLGGCKKHFFRGVVL